MFIIENLENMGGGRQIKPSAFQYYHSELITINILMTSLVTVPHLKTSHPLGACNWALRAATPLPAGGINR